MTKRLFLIAGAALSLGSFAQAQSTNQGRSLASELSADASGRTSSLAPAAQDFTVNTHGYEQFRFNWNSRQDDGGFDSNDNDQTIGFQNARTRLNFSGNIANENWGYFIQFGFSDFEGDSSIFRGTPSSSSSGASLEDAYGWYKMGNGWTLKFGQLKLPGTREELVGDTYLLFADRSVVNSEFTLGRAQQVQADYQGDQFRFAAAFSDGAQTANTDYPSGVEADFGLSARAEFKWAGDWKQAKDFTSFQNSEYFGMIGAAAHYQSGGDTVNTADATDYMLTIDASAEGNGWNAFAAFIYNNFDPTGGTQVTDMTFQLQGGIFVSADWELIAGYDVIMPDSDWGAGSDSDFSTFRVGVNHYVVPESHAIKITADLTYFLDAEDNTGPVPSTNTAVGLLPSAEDGEWNLRFQIQLMF